MAEGQPPPLRRTLTGDRLSHCDLATGDLVSSSPRALTSFDGGSMVSIDSWPLTGERALLDFVHMDRSSGEMPSISSGLTNQPWRTPLDGFRDFRSSSASLDVGPSDPTMGGPDRPEITTKFLSENGYFDMPLMQAAEQLGYSAGSLKRVCRKLGLARWPYRVRKSLRSVIAKTEEFMEETDESGVSNSKSSVLGALKAQMDDVMGIAGQGIDEGTRKYRQAIFKLNHKISKKVSGQRTSRAKIKVPATAAAQIALTAKATRRSSSSPSLCSEGDEGTLTGHHDLLLGHPARLAKISTLTDQLPLGRARSPLNPQEGTTPESRAHLRSWSSGHALGSGRPSSSSMPGSMEDLAEAYPRPTLSDPAPAPARRSGIDLRRQIGTPASAALQARSEDELLAPELLHLRDIDQRRVQERDVLRLLERGRSRSLPQDALGIDDGSFRARLHEAHRFRGFPPSGPPLQPSGGCAPTLRGSELQEKSPSLPEFSFTRRNAAERPRVNSLPFSKEQQPWAERFVKVEPGRVYRGLPVPEQRGPLQRAPPFEWQQQAHTLPMNTYGETPRASGSSFSSLDSYAPSKQEQVGLAPWAPWGRFSQATPLPSAPRATQVPPSPLVSKPNVLDTLSGVLPGPVVGNPGAPASWEHAQPSEGLPPLPHDDSDMMDLINDLGLF